MIFPSEGEVLKARCIRPAHEDLRPSMWIYPNGVYCFGCGTHWWPDQFEAELGDRVLDFQPAQHRASPPPRNIPMSLVKTFNEWLNTVYPSRLEWLFARGLRLEDSINPNQLGYDGTAFVIPVLDGSDVQALRFRRDEQWESEEDAPKYWGIAGLNKVTLYKPVIPEHVEQKSQAIHLCEGELDALRLSQEGFIAWSLTNGCRAFRPEHVSEFSGHDVKVLYDQDAPGRQAGRKIAGLLGARQVTWPEVLGKDVTEYLQRWSLQSLLTHL